MGRGGVAARMAREKKARKMAELEAAGEAPVQMSQEKRTTKTTPLLGEVIPTSLRPQNKPASPKKTVTIMDTKSTKDAKDSRKGRSFEKTRVCAHFLRKRCNYHNGTCNFAHTTEELTLGPINSSMRCELWAHGLCHNKNCPLKHDMNAPLPNPNVNYKEGAKATKEHSTCGHKHSHACSKTASPILKTPKTSPSKNSTKSSPEVTEARSTEKRSTLLTPDMFADLNERWSIIEVESDDDEDFFSVTDRRSWFDKTFVSACETASTTSTDGARDNVATSTEASTPDSECNSRPVIETERQVEEMIDEFGNSVFVERENSGSSELWVTPSSELSGSVTLLDNEPFYECKTRASVDCVVNGVQLGRFSVADLYMRMPTCYED